jgi:hypothetical protein
MATNGTTRRHQELRLCIGEGADGKPQHVVIGHLLETAWGEGKKSYDVELCITHLNPVLYQQVRSASGGRATVVCDKADFAKRYKAAVAVQAPTEPGEAVDGNDPDTGHE